MSEKKIGIMTIHKVNNYGAELQAFALQEKLNRLGFSAEIIDYLYYKHREYRYSRKARPFVRLGLNRRVKECLAPLLSWVKALPHGAALKRREAAFARFHQRYTRYSPITYRSIEQLHESGMAYDLYMVGSDQVWNPFANVSLKPYFLDFAPAGKPRISYASSFGVSTIPVEARPIYRECLNGLDRIAVREKQGVGIVEELTGRKAHHVVDPTLLLHEDDWKAFACAVDVERPYLLLYVLTPSDYATKLARRIAESLKLKLVRICKGAAKQDAGDSIHNIVDAGPAEFVGLFLNAAFVITNSFHGTAFSVNFHKPFYTVLPKNKPNNSRQQGLLETLRLEDRLISEGAPFPAEGSSLIDYGEAEILLQQFRDESVKYLLDAVNGDADA